MLGNIIIFSKLFIVIITAANPALADYYVYKGNDGVSLYTDQKLPEDKYTLIATVGRPPASVSCSGISYSGLERRAITHMPIIEQYARHFKLDPMMVKAIISVESCFDKHAVSRVGAKGLMQLMPYTAKKMKVHNIFNAQDNIRGGTAYLRLMLDQFDQSMDLALAAYNAGPKAVKKYGGIPPYQETQKYIKRIMNNYQRYKEKDN